MLIVEKMILQRSTQFRREGIASSYREQGGHIVAGIFSIFISCRLVGQCQANSLKTSRIQLLQHRHHLRAEAGYQRVRLVRHIDLGTELIAGRQGQGTIVIVDADKRRKAPATLVDIEFKGSQVAQQGMIIGFHMTTIVAVVVVGTEADGCRQTVKEPIGEVQLTTIDILLALHLRVEGISAGGNTFL